MQESSHCARCGGALAAQARFCGSCGAPAGAAPDPIDTIALKGAPSAAPASAVRAEAPAQEGGAAPADTIASQARAAADSARARLGGTSPEAAELLSQASAPGLQAAGIVAGLTALVLLAFGLVLAALPLGDSSLIRLAEGDFVGRIFWLATGPIGAPSSGPGGELAIQTMPLLGLAGTIAAFAYFTVQQQPKTTLSSPVAGLAWSLAAAIPFAIIMLLFGVIASVGDGDDGFQPDLASLFFLSLLWGSVGALVGRALIIRRDPTQNPLPDSARVYVPLLAAVFRPFALALAVAAVIGVIAVSIGALVSAPLFAGGDDDHRSVPFAVIEDATYVVEHGVHVLALGTLSRFESGTPPTGLPIPVDDGVDVADGSSFGLFDYRNGMPGIIFALFMVATLAVPAAFAVFAGFSLARRVGATSAGSGALWGLAVGPLWALGLTLLALVANKTAFTPLWGWSEPGATLGFTLLVTGVLGSVGGALSADPSRTRPAPAT